MYIEPIFGSHVFLFLINYKNNVDWRTFVSINHYNAEVYTKNSAFVKLARKLDTCNERN